MKNVFAYDESDVASDSWASNPAFERRHLRSIEKALRTAWDELHKNYQVATQLTTANEVIISHLLRKALNDLRENEKLPVDGYDTATFDKPHVGSEAINVAGKIRKPDIVFSLCGRRRPGVKDGLTDGIFVECKILSQTANLAAYCDNGMIRFVTGDYGHRMREGMMLAYVRSSQKMPDDLLTELNKPARLEKLATDGVLKKCSLTKLVPRVQISVHERNWPYQDDPGYPGPIELRHLWLQV